MNKILILGYGQMALSIIRGILEAKLHHRHGGKYYFEICGRSDQKIRDFLQRNALYEFFDILPKDVAINIGEKIVFLCIKSYGLENFVFRGDAFAVISVMAGININQIKKSISARGYVRVMPNTAAKYQKSSSAVYCEQIALDEVRELLESFGIVVSVEQEKLIDSSIATSGSAPAFIALIAQALIDAGVREGLNRKQSKELVCGMFNGFASLLAHEDPQSIIDSITSPGGTTIEGLSVLEDRGMRGAIMQACHQAVLKART